MTLLIDIEHSINNIVAYVFLKSYFFTFMPVIKRKHFIDRLMKVFISKSFAHKDREVNSYFERILTSIGLEIITAENFTGEPISKRVERLLAECDFLVGIYVIRYEDGSIERVVTSQWVMRETYTAYGQRKQFIALVEEGVNDIAGMEADRELIFFNRNDILSMQEATVKFLQALKWYGLI